MRQSFALVLGALLLWAFPAVASAQEPVPADTIRPPVAVEVPAGPAFSPAGAFVRSLLVPGWGQAWVGAPVRGGVYFAMESGSLWMLYKTRQKLREARAEQAWLHETGELPLTQRTALVEARQRQSEDWLTLSIFLLFLAGADAFVAAHLADFQDHVGVRPTAEGGLSVQGRIGIGGSR